MKAFTQIEFEIDKLKNLLTEITVKHEKLSQIDMLSGEGSKLREQMNRIKGSIIALNWIINSNVTNIYPL